MNHLTELKNVRQCVVTLPHDFLRDFIDILWKMVNNNL